MNFLEILNFTLSQKLFGKENPQIDSKLLDEKLFEEYLEL